MPVLVHAQEPMRLAVDAVPLEIVSAERTVRYDVEIAFLVDQRERGLMYRSDFPQNRAMLFKFENEAIIRMWMANTPLPLDMVFVDNRGKIVSLTENTTPFSYDIITSNAPARFVIELNAGQIKAQKIAVGQRVIHPGICGQCGDQK